MKICDEDISYVGDIVSCSRSIKEVIQEELCFVLKSELCDKVVSAGDVGFRIVIEKK